MKWRWTWSFPRMDEGEMGGFWRGLGGMGRVEVGSWSRERRNGVARGRSLQPPAVAQQGAGKAASGEGYRDDLCHGPDHAVSIGRPFAGHVEDLRIYLQILHRCGRRGCA